MENCLGRFGTYQYMWSRYGHDIKEPLPANENGTVWVTKRYIPTDLRVTAPVPRHKLTAPNVKDLPTPPAHWIPPREVSLGNHTRKREETIYRSQPSTRCEEWSTLREMLPSCGRPIPCQPPNWGAGHAKPPANTSELQCRFPHLNSPMTRYVDDMHLTNRLFKLH